MKRVALIVGLLLVLAMVGGGGLWWWRDEVEKAALNRTLVAAELAVVEGRWAEVRAILADQARRRGRPEAPDAARRWQKSEFQAAGGLRDFAALEALAAVNPALAGEDENAALWLWRIRRVENDETAAEVVRALWAGREKMPVLWACAEIDAALVAGRREEARALLAALPSEVAGAVSILLRKALIDADPAQRFQAMEDAYRAEPGNADFRSLRAGLLERRGEAAYARVDYVAALVADRENPLRRDDLASFYLRQGDLATAVQTWREGLDERSPDYQWVRAVFWGRVLGLPKPEAAAKLSESRKSRFAGWLATLPEDRFWDEGGYAALHLPAAFEGREPAVFWLRTMEALRVGDWNSAATMLAVAPSNAVAASPALVAALRVTAAVRAGTEAGRTGIAWPGTADGAHQWWAVTAKALRGDAAAVDEFSRVATGPLGAAAAFLAAGWTGPALALADPVESAGTGSPDWVRYGLLEARRTVRGPADALAWGERLPAYPPTDYAVAALKLGAGRTAEAEATLRGLATRGDDTGFAAAWLLGTWLLEQRRAAEAAEVVALASELSKSPEGAGLRARAALALGRADEAAKLYEPLAEISLEAGTYLARTAFATGDWVRARTLTKFWLERMPDNLQLRANLAAVVVAETEARAAAAKSAGGRP